ncbi:helix-turn-helix domain-containing protein [Streptomyces sp. NPDC049879]|uniref:helix-turn-helix domain-containing protein n=1 Tax=Streptomyces sp. NPDC049879 TaxID=3365598 RepID=UPI0037881338
MAVSGVETAELAALLMELKDRSGLSYGVLAKRLHMSASTLHRYCRGEALPPEFGTVERLARLCRATPEEQAELHRRWIAADTARQRERERKGPPPRPAVPVETHAAPVPEVRPQGLRVALAGAGVVAAVVAIALLVGLLTDGGDDGSGEGDLAAILDGGQEAEDAPLAVTTRPYAFDQCEGRYLVDLPPAQVPPPPTETDAAGWVRALEAVPAGEQLVELAVQGTGAETVVLRDLRVRVTATGEPLPWELYGGYSACGGGPVRTSAFDIDLDAASPRPTAVDGQQGPPLWVDESEPLVLYATAHAEERSVEWYLELEWSSGDRSGTLRIDDDGEPFRTSAVGDQREMNYMIGGTEWFDSETGEPVSR